MCIGLGGIDQQKGMAGMIDDDKPTHVLADDLNDGCVRGGVQTN